MKRPLLALVGVALFLGSTNSTQAGDVTWTGSSPTSGDWSLAANWDPGTPLSGDALFFGASPRTATSTSASFSLISTTFTAGAPAYTTTVGATWTLSWTGTGISNLSGQTQTFSNIGGLVSGTSGGYLQFFNSATAGTSTFVNNGQQVSGAFPGRTSFSTSSSAGSANILNIGGLVSGLFGGNTVFFNTSTAGNASVVNAAGTVVNSRGGYTQFTTSASAGTATVTNSGPSLSLSSGGVTQFFVSATAGNAVITNQGAGISGAIGLGGATLFSNVSTGGNAPS